MSFRPRPRPRSRHTLGILRICVQVYVSSHIFFLYLPTCVMIRVKDSDTRAAVSLWRELEIILSKRKQEIMFNDCTHEKCEMLHMRYEQLVIPFNRYYQLLSYA